MKKWMCVILWLCIGLLLLPGCREKAPESTEPIISWENIPQLTYGQMEEEKLSVLPWYSGRTEISTSNSTAETEQGYYVIYDNRHLFYADKVDLSNWVLVCNQPDCEHNGAIGCSAFVYSNWLFVKNDRLYFLDTTGSGLYDTYNVGEIYVSTKLDGSDKRLEYVYEESHIGMTGGTGATPQLGKVTLRKASRLNPEGQYDTHIYRIDEQGGREIQLPDGADENTLLAAGISNGIRGEPLLFYGSMATGNFGYYRMVGENFQKISVDSALTPNGYFDGKTLRAFQANDGYYDVNTETGEAVKLAPCYYEDSWAVILAPNCIIETNFIRFIDLLTPPYARPQLPQGESKLALFDGESWREVTVPPELRELSIDNTLEVLGLTSDSILVYIRGESFRTAKNNSRLYRIPLGEEELHLEYCGEIVPLQEK